MFSTQFGEYFQLVFKLKSAGISWKYPQNCVKQRLSKPLFWNEMDFSQYIGRNSKAWHVSWSFIIWVHQFRILYSVVSRIILQKISNSDRNQKNLGIRNWWNHAGKSLVFRCVYPVRDIQPPNNQSCFPQFFPWFFLSLSSWKRKQTFIWSKT